MVVKTRRFFLYEFFAPPQFVFYADVLQKRFKRGHVGERAVIGGAVFYHRPCFEKPRKLFVRNTEHRVRFSVFQLYVEVRGILFYQVVLQNERLILVLGDDIFN